MIIKKLYRCEYCNTDYASEGAAISCENYHRKGLKIVSARYISCAQGVRNSGAMPVTITVEDSEGFRAVYKR